MIFAINFLIHLFLVVLFFAGFNPTWLNSGEHISYKLIQQKHQTFIFKMLPQIRLANHKIAEQRQKLISLHKEWLANGKLGPSQQQWLTKLAKAYKTKANFNNKSNWNQLLVRVDIIPNALILAQSINESGWGQSRFAKEGNNYFGQWCFYNGCGIVPKHRPKGATYEVAKFSSREASIAAYILNLNTNSHYRGLRELRAKLRKQGKTITGLRLTSGLSRYSQRGKSYDKIIKTIIAEFGLQKFDNNYQQLLAMR